MHEKHEMFLWQVTWSVLDTLQVRIYLFTDFWVYTFQTQYSPWFEVYPTCVIDKVEYVMPEAWVFLKDSGSLFKQYSERPQAKSKNNSSGGGGFHVFEHYWEGIFSTFLLQI